MRGANHYPAVQTIVDACSCRLERLQQEVTLLAKLSAREKQVFTLLLSGKPQVAIGFDLGISSKTVNTFKTSLLGKLKCASDVELIKLAVRHRLVDVWSDPLPLPQRSKFVGMGIQSDIRTEHRLQLISGGKYS